MLKNQIAAAPLVVSRQRIDDLLWRDTTTGATAIWFLDATSVASTAGIGSVPTNWVISGTGDANGDGKGDILWRDTTIDQLVGTTDFSALQDDLKHGRHDRFVYYAFDLLHLDGLDTRSMLLAERKRALASLLSEGRAKAPRILYSEHFEDGAALYTQASEMGLEGIVSKRADAPYRSGRGETWLKVKCVKRERFVVVGFAPEGSSGIAKLRLARREGRGLVYVGRVGTGWDRKTAAAIRRALAPLATP